MSNFNTTAGFEPICFEDFEGAPGWIGAIAAASVELLQGQPDITEEAQNAIDL